MKAIWHQLEWDHRKRDSMNQPPSKPIHHQRPEWLGDAIEAFLSCVLIESPDNYNFTESLHYAPAGKETPEEASVTLDFILRRRDASINLDHDALEQLFLTDDHESTVSSDGLTYRLTGKFDAQTSSHKVTFKVRAAFDIGARHENGPDAVRQEILRARARSSEALREISDAMNPDRRTGDHNLPF